MSDDVIKVITIGRDEKNDKVIVDPHASRCHLQIIQHKDGHFNILDFGSTNGTYVNGQKIKGEVPLSEMDIVKIGNTPIPWREYFDDDESFMSQSIITLSPDDEFPESPSLRTNKKKQRSLTGWLIASRIVSLIAGIGCVVLSLYYGGGYIIMSPHVILFISGLFLIVLSVVLLFKIFNKKLQ